MQFDDYVQLCDFLVQVEKSIFGGFGNRAKEEMKSPSGIVWLGFEPRRYMSVVIYAIG